VRYFVGGFPSFQSRRNVMWRESYQHFSDARPGLMLLRDLLTSGETAHGPA